MLAFLTLYVHATGICNNLNCNMLKDSPDYRALADVSTELSLTLVIKKKWHQNFLWSHLNSHFPLKLLPRLRKHLKCLSLSFYIFQYTLFLN